MCALQIYFLCLTNFTENVFELVQYALYDLSYMIFFLICNDRQMKVLFFQHCWPRILCFVFFIKLVLYEPPVLFQSFLYAVASATSISQVCICLMHNPLQSWSIDF